MTDAPEKSTLPQRRLPGALTPLDVASGMLLPLLAPVQPRDLAWAEALGRYAAAPRDVAAAHPRHHIAICDGWAFRAADLTGASSYAPMPLLNPPDWVEAGEALPDGADCVIEPAAVEAGGPMPLVLLESFPGENIRRAGEDLPDGWLADLEGRRLSALDLLAADSAGIARVQVRAPRIALVDIPASTGAQSTTALIERLARAAGANVTRRTAPTRNADAIVATLRATGDADLVLTMGGTGGGRADHMVDALERVGRVLAHGIALRPGRTAAIATLGATPVIALPGLPDQALAVWWALVEPAIEHLAAAKAGERLSLPIDRKIASAIGLAEIVLLAQRGLAFHPLATGDLPLGRLSEATHVFIAPADSEGCAPGTPVAARRIRMDLSQ